MISVASTRFDKQICSEDTIVLLALQDYPKDGKHRVIQWCASPSMEQQTASRRE